MRKAFTLVELLAVIALLGILAALSFPAWRNLIDSGSRRTGEARVMEALEHARCQAVSSGRDVWVVLRHDGRGGHDADRIVVRDGTNLVPLGGWDRLPAGITFRTGTAAVPDAAPPREILECSGAPQGPNDILGAVMFLRSGSVGWPKPGAGSLCIPLDSKQGTSFITLSRGTGRASLARSQAATP